MGRWGLFRPTPARAASPHGPFRRGCRGRTAGGWTSVIAHPPTASIVVLKGLVACESRSSARCGNDGPNCGPGPSSRRRTPGAMDSQSPSAVRLTDYGGVAVPPGPAHRGVRVGSRGAVVNRSTDASRSASRAGGSVEQRELLDPAGRVERSGPRTDSEPFRLWQGRTAVRYFARGAEGRRHSGHRHNARRSRRQALVALNCFSEPRPVEGSSAAIAAAWAGEFGANAPRHAEKVAGSNGLAM